MPIPYKPFKITSPLSKENTQKYYAKVITHGEIDLRNLAEKITSISTLSTVDIVAVLESLLKVIPEELLSGYIVKLGDLGSFAPSVKSEGSKTEKEFTSKMIKETTILFKPGKYIKKRLKQAKYEKI